jgi:anti-sigma28 factor (negative regulator of flagellin synthesis)
MKITKTQLRKIIKEELIKEFGYDVPDEEENERVKWYQADTYEHPAGWYLMIDQEEVSSSDAYDMMNKENEPGGDTELADAIKKAIEAAEEDTEY